MYGVDIVPRHNYPFGMHVGDALTFLERNARRIRRTFQAVHASWPCQTHSALTKGNRARAGWEDAHADLITPGRALMDAVGLPYVIENVAGAPIRKDLSLCGEMFGLQVLRHRFFELGGWHSDQPPHAPHRGRVAGYRHGVWYDGPYYAVYGDGGGKGTVAEWQHAMGIYWTNDRVELAEAIPPAYTKFIGQQLITMLT